MTSPSPTALLPADAVARFSRYQAGGDSDRAVAFVEALLDDGADPLDVLLGVIAASQREVGSRWQRGEWSVAEEHAATAIAIAATEAIGRHARRLPAHRGHVLVACAEREWHALPAMIIGYALRARGWNITLLGASTPAVRLSQYLHDLGPDATAVSCSVLSALPTTRRFIEASTAAGVPVVVGGSAFGSDATRATALGATAWAPTASAAIDTMDLLPPVVRAAAPLPHNTVVEQAAIDLAHHRLATRLGEQWSFAAQITATQQHHLDGVEAIAADAVNQALHAVSAALLTDDPRPLPDTAAWVTALLTARGANAALVAELGHLLAHALHDFPVAQALVSRHWPLRPLPTGALFDR